jgi:hypothetical protein
MYKCYVTSQSLKPVRKFHKGVLGCGGIFPPLLTSALDEGEWSASRHDLFTLRGRNFLTQWIGGWVGRRTSQDDVE